MGRVMLAIAANLFTAGKAARSRAVLNCCTDPKSKRILQDVLLAEELSAPFSRKAKRAQRWGVLGCKYMESGDYQLAARCFAMYTRIKPMEPAGHLLYAKALAASGENNRAVSEADRGLKLCDKNETRRIACLYAQVMTQTGHPRKAKEYLIKASPDVTDVLELMNYIYALAAADAHEMIYNCALRCVRGGCVEPAVLNALSVSALKLHKNGEAVTEGWNLILAMDPLCREAEYCLSEYNAGRLDGDNLSYLWNTDPDMRIVGLRGLFGLNGDELIYAAARAINSDEESALLALSLLLGVNDPAADRIIASTSVRPDLSERIRNEAAAIMDAKQMVLQDEFTQLNRACRESCDEIIPRVDARSAKIIIDAAQYDINRDIAARIWKRFLERGNGCVALNADAACAALICAAKKKAHLRPDYRQLMREYELRPRQLKRVLKPLYRLSGITEDVDNAF